MLIYAKLPQDPIGNIDSAPVESAPIEIGAQGRPTNNQYGAHGNLHKILMNTVTVDIM